MGVTNYYSFGGMLIGEEAVGDTGFRTYGHIARDDRGGLASGENMLVRWVVSSSGLLNHRSHRTPHSCLCTSCLV